jgi:Tol biopolymer transport system component
LQSARVAVVSLVLLGSGRAQVTERVSLDYLGHQSPGGGWLPPGAAISDDGRFVVFNSPSVLVPSDTNSAWDVMVRDRLARTTELMSVDSAGTVGNGFSGEYGICISPDGRFVAFESRANNFVPGDTNWASDVFLHDRLTGKTDRVSVGTGGVQGNGPSFYPSMSADGRYVAFTSAASNLVHGDTNGHWDVFVHDRETDETERVSLATNGTQGDDDSYRPAISADGLVVAYESLASNLVSGDTNGHWDVFLTERLLHDTQRVSVSTSGTQGNGDSWACSVSRDGRYVAFTSFASNLVAGDSNMGTDVFLHDRMLGTTECVSIGTNGTPGNSSSGMAGDHCMSPDGRFVSLYSGSTDMIPGDPLQAGAVVRDRWLGTTERVGVTTGGTVPSSGSCGPDALSSDGRYVVLGSDASDLVPGDTNGNEDIFVHDRFSAGFTSLCEPGNSGVIGCPCSNPPSGPDRGCDNSSGTGGASLSASGIAYLSMDDLYFTTTGEGPIATSLLLQGDAPNANGSVYGQGVRCAGGRLVRLFVRRAVGGGVRVPDFGAGDPAISARSASKGDVIQPGRSRWYLVYYRDPVVLGGCASSSTFNTTQTGRVTWWP